MGNRREATSVVTSTLTGLINDNFNKNEENMSGSDVSSSDSDASERVNLDGLNMDGIEVDKLRDSDDSGRLDSAHGSDSDGQKWAEFNLENDMSNPRLKVGMLFKSKDSLKEAAKQLFQRRYICLQAYKDGYKAGCRRIVGLDRCFLKGYYGGYLLAAVRIDTNNGIYPLAYAAVESENQASWLWFLELLTIDLEIMSSYQISFMSDKQKGLVEAICMLFPNAEIRHCVRHLHANFKKAGFRTKELKYLFWKVARASTTRKSGDAMDELRKANQHAYDWLKEKNPTHWSRSHFSIRSHSDILMILEARGKPILTMIETIRTNIMLLIVKKKEEADKWKGILCLKIEKKRIEDKYQVEYGLGSQHVVDLVENSYSCRNWDLTGIPCMHALAVIHLKEEFPKTYVQTWYTKQTQLQIYSNFVSPVRGPKQWVSLSNMLSILPPPLRRPLGRPTKVRRKEPEEPQIIERLSKRGVEIRCNKCKRVGHNKKSCKGEVGQNIPVKRHKVDVPTQQQATPNQQKGTPTQQAALTQLPTAPTHQQAALKQKLPFKRKPTTIRWMPSTEESSMTDH
ncbi:uncharacterized protein LOC108468311 [Gossypium arboreum]|uniref:uncharacterized protein LOC108468311 n=1 Tax=Gossypium arboreum TaxID=29729 RepID=UPI0008190BE7|nr:uncharacterized protein LOC108468311 [Gossypium arboreum]